jgi:hypothetical protein
MFSETKAVQVKPQRGAAIEVTFSDYKLAKENIFKVGYQIIENNSSTSIKNYQIYLANRNIEIKVEPEPKPLVKNKIPDAFIAAPFQYCRDILENVLRKTSKSVF